MNTSTSTNNFDDINVGVAVVQTSLEVFIFELEMHWQESNTHEGIKNILQNLCSHKP